MSIDPENIKFEAEFKKATDGTENGALEVIFNHNQYNFEKIGQKVGEIGDTLGDHLVNHKIKDEKNKAVKGVLIKGGAIGAGGLTLLIAFLGLVL